MLDPFMGSGTAVLEAALAHRTAMGVDIDPLATLIARVKTTSLEIERVEEWGRHIVEDAHGGAAWQTGHCAG